MGVINKFLEAIKLNDDDYDEDEFLDDDLDDEDEEVEEKPRKHFFDRHDEEEEKASAVKQPKATKTSSKPTSQQKKASKITPMRTTRKPSGNMEVVVVKPSSMEDTREIADALIEQCTVVLNLEGIDVEVAQRIIDFTSGACYSIDGNLQKIASFIFILTPSSVDISGEYQDILNGAFDLPTIRTEF